MPISRKKYILFLLGSAAVLVLVLLIAGLFAGGAPAEGASSAGQTPLRISEYMAKNTAYPGPDGRCSDWVEIENTSDAPFNLSGYRLTDDVTKAKYAFPVGTLLPAGGRIVVWCDPEGSGAFYAPFALSSKGGETLLLMNSANTVLDRIETLRSPRNMSIVRTLEGELSVSSTPTPGYENSREGYEAYLAAAGLGAGEVRLSELMSAEKLVLGPEGIGWDWVEIENTGIETAELSGMHLTDKEGEGRYTFPEGTVLAPGERLLIWCSGDETQGLDHAPFKLSKQGGESVLLTDKTGNVLDRVTLPYLSDDSSYARIDGVWTVTTMVTPGYENTQEGNRAWLASTGYGESRIIITEVCPRNYSGLSDADGESHDWIELYNAGTGAVSLEGWYLSDDEEDMARWRLPAVSLDPGEHLVIFASGKDRSEGELHTDFAVSAGETITLMTPVGILADKVSVPLVADDASWALVNGAWSESAPTPGQ